MEFSKLGVAFVDENIPDYKKLELKISEKEEELIEEAKVKFAHWLQSQGLENVMGIIVQKKNKNARRENNADK